MFLFFNDFEWEVMIQPYLDSIGGGFPFVLSEIRKNRVRRTGGKKRPV